MFLYVQPRLHKIFIVMRYCIQNTNILYVHGGPLNILVYVCGVMNFEINYRIIIVFTGYRSTTVLELWWHLKDMFAYRFRLIQWRARDIGYQKAVKNVIPLIGITLSYYFEQFFEQIDGWIIISGRRPNILYSGNKNIGTLMCRNRVCGNYLINIYLSQTEFLETITRNMNSHGADFISST